VELTALPQTPWLYLSGLLLRAGRRKRKGRRRGGKKRGKRKGGEGKEWEGPAHPDI